MENDNIKIIALALGIPSTTFVSLALLIAISFHYNLINRIGRQRTTPTVATTPTNDVDAILLEQLPPRIFAPIPRHSIPIHDLLGNNQQEVVGESTDPEDLEGGTPTPTRRRMPVIEPTGTPSYAPYVPRTPSPGTYARFAARVGGFDVGRDIRPVAPTTNYDTWADRHPTPPPQPVSLPRISGTTSTSHTVLTSLLPEQTHPITEPHPQQDTPGHGTSLHHASRHSSLYESRQPIASTSALMSLQALYAQNSRI